MLRHVELDLTSHISLETSNNLVYVRSSIKYSRSWTYSGVGERPDWESAPAALVQMGGGYRKWQEQKMMAVMASPSTQREGDAQRGVH